MSKFRTRYRPFQTLPDFLTISASIIAHSLSSEEFELHNSVFLELKSRLVTSNHKSRRKSTVHEHYVQGIGYLVVSRGIGINGMRPPTPPATPPPPRPMPARRSKSGLFSSKTVCFCCAGSGGRQRGLMGRSEMDVKWLISLVVGEQGPSAMSSSIGFGSPLPGVRADGNPGLPPAGSLRLAKRGSASSK